MIKLDMMTLYENLRVGEHFPGGPVVKNTAANQGDMDSIPGLGRFHMQQDN